jgi:hypothetical protein
MSTASRRRKRRHRPVRMVALRGIAPCCSDEGPSAMESQSPPCPDYNVASICWASGELWQRGTMAELRASHQHHSFIPPCAYSIYGETCPTITLNRLGVLLTFLTLLPHPCLSLLHGSIPMPGRTTSHCHPSISLPLQLPAPPRPHPMPLFFHSLFSRRTAPSTTSHGSLCFLHVITCNS